MSNLIQTKERLNSTKSTQKVIKAMELVASSKIKKAKEKALNNQAYFDNVVQTMRSLFTYEDMQAFLNLEANKKNTLIIGITSDMGLCGAYNNNVLKKFNQLLEEDKDHIACMIGNKGINKLKFENIKLDHEVIDFGKQVAYEVSQNIAQYIIDKYQNGEVNKVLIVYTYFKNPLVQEVKVFDLFNLEPIVNASKYNYELIIDGDKKTIFNNLFMQYVNSVCYYAILNSIASEYAARRNSMDAANNNSLEIIEQLNLEMNRIRQAMITQEIAEIIGGAEALNKE